MNKPILENYNHTYNQLKDASLKHILLQAYWDTFGVRAKTSTGKYHGTSLGDAANSKLDSDGYFADPWQMTKTFLGVHPEGPVGRDLNKSSEGVAIEPDKNNPIRVIARFLSNLLRTPEFFLAVVDYGVEACLAKTFKALEQITFSDEDTLLKSLAKGVVKSILTVVALVTLGIPHIALKASAIMMRLIFSSSNAWREADAIDPRLGAVARVATLALTVGLCFALPMLVPYFAYIHAPVIIHGLTIATNALASWAPSTYVLQTGLAIITGIPQIGKMFTHTFSKQFNQLMDIELMAIKPKFLERRTASLLPTTWHDYLFKEVIKVSERKAVSGRVNSVDSTDSVAINDSFVHHESVEDNNVLNRPFDPRTKGSLVIGLDVNGNEIYEDEVVTVDNVFNTVHAKSVLVEENQNLVVSIPVDNVPPVVVRNISGDGKGGTVTPPHKSQSRDSLVVFDVPPASDIPVVMTAIGPPIPNSTANNVNNAIIVASEEVAATS